MLFVPVKFGLVNGINQTNHSTE